MTTTAPICALMCKIFERHSPDGTIKNVRPINGGSRFRDAISDIGNHRYLWYEEFILTGDQNTPAYTTRLVCIEGDDAMWISKFASFRAISSKRPTQKDN